MRYHSRHSDFTFSAEGTQLNMSKQISTPSSIDCEAESQERLEGTTSLSYPPPPPPPVLLFFLLLLSPHRTNSDRIENGTVSRLITSYAKNDSQKESLDVNTKCRNRQKEN